MNDLIVFVDDIKRFEDIRYFLHLLINQWRQNGLTIQVHAGLNQLPSARIALMHIDSTRIPTAYKALSDSYQIVLNLQADDISKKRISRSLLTQNDQYSGPVIVKTDANCGGAGELFQRYRTPILGRLRRMLDRRRHWTTTGILSPSQYPVYASANQVPDKAWSNSSLVVERFMAEQHGDLYALRQWVFFGEREINKISFSNNPVVKASNIVSSDMLDHAPPSLRDLRAKLGFDYGKFDYVLHNGKAVLLDANRTPAFASLLGDKAIEYAAALAPGLHGFLQ